ncbi:prephenate dehydrogenase [Bryobacter aggregatus]|uniref:prephenate dehydrogenase n=1 Tax=Bryobacter aggregatus TaxID=360054 RepID=UPI00068C276B|nr:prephenate dehydrogenase/arogenate dehydrogenase family protein [Bryobacter aggregatus]
MNTVAIVGTGLLGSSFGLGLKRARLAGRIIGVSSPAVVAKALAVGAIDESMPLEEAVGLADLVLLAQPVRRILKTLALLDPIVKEGALVTDVGSTKAEICQAAATHLRRARFVGGHPMAGREVRGPEGASADLFAGRPWVLTGNEPELVALVVALHGKPVFLDAAEHDRLVAYSSHLPQLVSTTLAALLENQAIAQVAGPGVLDMTRLALSSHDLWQDILSTNAANIDAALSAMIASLEQTREALQQGREEALFLRANRVASALRTQ